MLTYILKRLLLIIPVMFCVVTLVFFMLRLVPGDPVDFILGESALQETRQALIKQFHFDQPLWQQYVIYLKDLLHGNLGRSYFSPEPVNELIYQRFLATLELGGLAILWAALFSIPFGIISAVFEKHWPDRIISSISLLGVSIPTFYLGPLLVLIFSVYLDWFPISGRELPGSAVLPSLTLGLALSSLLTRFTRASLLEVLQKDYVRTARAKGLASHTVLIKHAFRTALVPIIAILGLQLGTLMAGSVVTEKIFSWPGLGSLMLDAISRRDYALVQGAVILMAVTYVVINLLTDIFNSWVDPRFRVNR